MRAILFCVHLFIVLKLMASGYPAPDLKVCGHNGEYSFNDITQFHKCIFTLDGLPSTAKKYCIRSPMYHKTTKIGFVFLSNESASDNCNVGYKSGWVLKDRLCLIQTFWTPQKNIITYPFCWHGLKSNQVGYFWKGHTGIFEFDDLGEKGSCNSACHFPSDPAIDVWRGCTCHSKMNATNCMDWYESCLYYISKQEEAPPSATEREGIDDKTWWIILGCVLGFIACCCLLSILLNIELDEETFLRWNDKCLGWCSCCRQCFFDYRRAWYGNKKTN